MSEVYCAEASLSSPFSKKKHCILPSAVSPAEKKTGLSVFFGANLYKFIIQDFSVFSKGKTGNTRYLL